MFNLLVSIMFIMQIVPTIDKVHVGDIRVLSQTYSVEDNKQNYFAGKIMIHLILPESNGVVDLNEEDWNPDELEKYVAMVRDVMEWYKSIYSIANIEYTIDAKIEETDYEVSRAEYDTWLHNVLHTASIWDSAYIKMMTTINKDESSGYDTSFYLFIVKNDTTHSFTGGTQGYAYLNGPYALINTWPNASSISTMAHEIGHIFGALDQYAAARTSCEQTSGVYNAPNFNTDYEYCGVTHTSSIMKNSFSAYLSRSIDPYARMQMGVKDNNCNGVVDYLDKNTENNCKYLYIPLVGKG